MKQTRTVITRYKLNKGNPSLRLALVTDLHERDPEPVLQLLRQEKPDLILIAGDLLERKKEGMSEWTREKMDEWQGLCLKKGPASLFRKLVYLFPGVVEKETDPKNAYMFLREAARLAPVYDSVGNHEWYYLEEDRKIFAENHITLLDNADTEVEIRGKKIRIGGLSTRYDLNWLREFSQKSGYKILLCHHPEYYERYVKGTECDTFDLILSGHVHGGQWRIFGKGVYSPGQGLFPKYSRGIYDGKMIVSAGLANTIDIPRFGNPCELVMIETD